MRIIIIPSWYPTTSDPINGIFFKEQAQALRKNGHEVIVIIPQLWSVKTLGKHGEQKGISFQMDDGLPTYRYNGYNFSPKISPLTIKFIYSKVKRMYEKVISDFGKPDLIHAHSCIWGGVYGAKLSTDYSIPLIITEHSSKIVIGEITKYQRYHMRKALNTSKKVVAVGPSLMKALGNFVDKDKMVIIPNIVNVEKFRISNKMIERELFEFFSLSYLKESKGIDILIKAFSKMKNTNCRLVIGGDGDERVKLEQLVSRLNLTDRITFVGHLQRSEVRINMQKCDAFVLPSKYETFGVVYIEALASGKPIIATKCGGPEIIVNNSNGVLVPIDDVDGLSKAMDFVINNYDKYIPFKIREDCINRFSEKAVLSQLNEIFTEAII